MNNVTILVNGTLVTIEPPPLSAVLGESTALGALIVVCLAFAFLVFKFVSIVHCQNSRCVVA
jgi:hypothetical protein